MTARWRTSLVRKELQALGSAWLASAALALLGAAFWPGGAFIGYAAGTFLLAAMSIGHEYTGRTLPSLLAQPVSRRQVFLVKIAVVVGLVAALGALASLVDLAGVDHLWRSPTWYRRPENAGLLTSLNVGTTTALLLPGLAAVCLAPWFTMVSRGPLGGLVFSAAAVGLAWLGGDLIGTVRFGLAPTEVMKVTAFRTQFAWWATSFLSLAGAALTWRTFVQLEAHEGSAAQPAALVRRGSRDAEAGRLTGARRSRWGQVVRKELHLQKMVFVIAGLYLVFWFAISWSARFLAPTLAVLLAPFSYVYAGTVALLLGSFASAEERQLGTLDWQVLMPVSAWKPWALKVLVACGLCLLLGFALPWTLESTAALPNDAGSVRAAGAGLPLALFGLTIMSLYISSASTGGLRALIASLAAAVPVVALGGGLVWLFDTTFSDSMPVLRESGWYRTGAFRAIRGLVDLRPPREVALIAALMLAIAPLLVRLALGNHASADRNLKRVWRQLGWMGAWSVAFTFVMGSLQAATLDDWHITGASGFRARGHITLEGNAPRTLGERHSVFIELWPATGRAMGGGWGMARPDLTFSTTYARPGRCLVDVFSYAPSWVLKSVMYHGRDISEVAIDVTADMDDVVVTLSNQLGRIEATVDDPEHTQVYLFPADPALWQDPAVMYRRFRDAGGTADSRTTGVVAFDMPPDGEYLIVALPLPFRGAGAETLKRAVALAPKLTWGAGAEINAKRAAILAEIAPLADRIQAKQGTTIKTRLTVRR